MSHFVGEEETLACEEIGAKRPGKVHVMSHRRGWPPSAAVPDPAGSWQQISEHTRSMPDVWDYKGQWDEVGYGKGCGEHCGITKIRSYVKDKKIVTVALIESKLGSKLMFAITAPMPAGSSESEMTMGWSPWGSIKSAAKSLSKTARRSVKTISKVVSSPSFQKLAASAVSSAAPAWHVAYSAISNPAVRKFAMQVAPMAGAAFGIPPQFTAMATGVLQSAMSGNPQAMAKVQNISQQAARGYGPAVQLRNTMSMLYRGGMQQWGQGRSFPQRPTVPQMPQFRPPRMPWQQYGSPPLPYGMHRYNIPTPGWGQGYVSGFLYNIPYRGLAQAVLESPTLKVRALYHQGMVGARRPGIVNVVSHKRGWPPSAEVPDPAGSWMQVSEHTRAMPDVWDYKGQWSE